MQPMPLSAPSHQEVKRSAVKLERVSRENVGRSGEKENVSIPDCVALDTDRSAIIAEQGKLCSQIWTDQD